MQGRIAEVVLLEKSAERAPVTVVTQLHARNVVWDRLLALGDP